MYGAKDCPGLYNQRTWTGYIPLKHARISRRPERRLSMIIWALLVSFNSSIYSGIASSSDAYLGERERERSPLENSTKPCVPVSPTPLPINERTLA